MKQLFFSTFLFLFYFGSLEIRAQVDTSSRTVEIVSSDWKENGLTLGGNFSRYFYGEIGHYRSYVWEAGGFPIISTSMNYACEFSYLDGLVLAPKVQARLNVYFVSVSLSTLLYSNLKEQYAWKVRPEVGVGLWTFDIHYGYNIGILKNDFELANNHVVSLRYYLKLRKKHLSEYDGAGRKVNR